MATNITINGTVTLDESLGLQTGGVAAGSEDNNDSDVALSVLQSGAASFYTRLFDPGELNLSSAFATANGVAKSLDNFIAVSATGTIASLGFVNGSGGSIPVYAGVATGGTATGLSAVDGGAISLFLDAELGNRMVLGVDANNNIVFALFLDPNAGLTQAKVWMVQFEAIANPDDANADDPVNLFDALGVAAGANEAFDFSGLPSGQNLFGMVGNASTALVVIGKVPVLNPDGTLTNTSNTINTSQGGGPTTIGVNNQMFDVGDGAYFTFVNNPDPNFLATALSATEADDADNILFGSRIEVDGGFLLISQLQGAKTAQLKLTAYNGANNTQDGSAFVTGGLGTGAAVTILTVKVTHLNGTSQTFNINALTATITIIAGDKVEWTTSGNHDQVLVEGVAGKFDIGGFGVNQPSSASVDIGSQVRFEDDGPDVELVLDGDAELVIDESDIPLASASILVGDLLSTNTANFGTDGQGTNASAYKLLLSDDNSGLFDTESGDEVLLAINGAGTVITGSVNGGADVVFTIEVDPATGEVTVDQLRAMKHGDSADPDEADTPLTFANGLVGLRRTITDGDDDSDSDDADISPIFKFEDDGPAPLPATEDPVVLLTDDTDITDEDAVSTDDIFPGTPDFGKDGPGEVDFELSLAEENADSGLIDTETGEKILLVTEGDDVVGYVDEDGDGTIELGETLEAIRYSLSVVDDDTKNVNFTAIRSVVHTDTGDPDEAGAPQKVAANLVFIDRIATDGDGDVAETTSFDIGDIATLKDDGPEIGDIDDGIVDSAAGDSVTNPLNGDTGNDPNASPYIVTAFTESIIVGGKEITGVLAANEQSVTYYDDTNGDDIIGNAGDTAFYRLTLNQAGAGEYTFEVLVNPPPAFEDFDFGGLPSGQNLFGIVGESDFALVVIGKVPVLNPDGTLTNTSNTINTSQGGGPTTIGVNNQMFDPGDGAYFTFVDSPDPNFLAGALSATEADDSDNILFGQRLEVDQAFLNISQLQGAKTAQLRITCFDGNDTQDGKAFATTGATGGLGTGTQVTIVEVKVTHTDGTFQVFAINALTATVTIRAGDRVEWTTSTPHDQVLVEGVAGKFDIGGFGALQGQDQPDNVLEFTVQVTDGDGDIDESSFAIGIDGTGIFDDDEVGGVDALALLSQSSSSAADAELALASAFVV